MLTQQERYNSLIKRWLRRIFRYVATQQKHVSKRFTHAQIRACAQSLIDTHDVSEVSNESIRYTPKVPPAEGEVVKFMDLSKLTVTLKYQSHPFDLNSLLATVGDSSDKQTPAIRILGYYSECIARQAEVS